MKGSDLKTKKVLKYYIYLRPWNLRTDRKNQSGQFCTGLNSLQSTSTYKLFYLCLTWLHLQDEETESQEILVPLGLHIITYMSWLKT